MSTNSDARYWRIRCDKPYILVITESGGPHLVHLLVIGYNKKKTMCFTVRHYLMLEKKHGYIDPYHSFYDIERKFKLTHEECGIDQMHSLKTIFARQV